MNLEEPLTRKVMRVMFDHGYSVNLKTGQVLSKTGAMLTGCVRKNGYNAVCVYIKGLTGPRGYQINQHQIVAVAKFGADAVFAEGIEVRHKDGNRLNNDLSNIEIGTRLENIMDMSAEQRSARIKGQPSPHRLLNEDEVKYIRNLYNRGIVRGECKKMSEELGVSKTTISEIGNGKTYNVF